MSLFKKIFPKTRNIKYPPEQEEYPSKEETTSKGYASRKNTKCSACSEGYCQPCNSNHWRDNFSNWTSGDDEIDKLIQESQLKADGQSQLLEWIKYSNLKE